jgi:hypothetical protein
MNTVFVAAPVEWIGRRASRWLVATSIDLSYKAYQFPNTRYPDIQAGGIALPLLKFSVGVPYIAQVSLSC